MHSAVSLNVWVNRSVTGAGAMNRFHFFRIKNSMLFSNFVSNLIGVSVVFFLTLKSEATRPADIIQLAHQINTFFLPAAFALPWIITVLYERPIRSYLNMWYEKKAVSEALILKARQKLLNEPFFLIAIDLGVWLAAAVLYSGLFWAQGADPGTTRVAFFRSLYTGLITTTVAFFVFEFVLQRRVVPYFFPNGGLSMTPKTLRIRIRTRLIALLFASNLVPFISILDDIWRIFPIQQDPYETLGQLKSAILSQVFVFMGVGIWLTFLVSSNLTKPLKEITHVLRQVNNGLFDNKVRVTSNDEIGYTGDVINDMTEGLKERDFVKETFGKYVTKEIRDEILSGRISLDGELKDVTVLFADLRNFTPMVETIPPKEVVKIINAYFKEMDEAIQQYNGLVLQYIGDEIEAVFGAPIVRENHPVMAVSAALEMRRRLQRVNRNLNRQGYPALSHGIGIHTGQVVAANIGSPDRLSYALVGDTVNLASRLQGLNKEFGTEIILSAATGARIDGNFELKELPAAHLKGKRKEVRFFSLA